MSIKIMSMTTLLAVSACGPLLGKSSHSKPGPTPKTDTGVDTSQAEEEGDDTVAAPPS